MCGCCSQSGRSRCQLNHIPRFVRVSRVGWLRPSVPRPMSPMGQVPSSKFQGVGFMARACVTLNVTPNVTNISRQLGRKTRRNACSEPTSRTFPVFPCLRELVYYCSFGQSEIVFLQIKLDGLLTLCVCSLCLYNDAAKRIFDETKF